MNRSIIAALAAAIASSALAQAPEDVVVVTATRFPSRASSLVSDITVIEREAIERAGQGTLVDLLQQQPALEVINYGGPGQTSGIFIRGASTAQVLVLIDGLRIGSATSGTAALEHIPLEQIERVEILRGPASSLYGADALGGVVQIFTRTAAGGPARPNFSFGYGTYRTARTSLGLSGQAGDTRYAVQLGAVGSRGFSAIRAPDPLAFADPFNPDADGYTDKNMTGRLVQKLGADHELRFNFFSSDARVHFDEVNCDAATGSVCTSNFDNRTKQTLASTGLELRSRVSSSWQSTLRLGTSTDDYTSIGLDPVLQAETRSLFRTDQNQLLWQNDVETRAGRLMLALEHTGQRVSGSTDFTVRTRAIESLVAGYHLSEGPHQVQASARRDQNSQFGAHASGSLAYSYRFGSYWRAGISGGTAFRAPTFNDLYFPFTPALFYGGNPDLRPEQARSYEASLRNEAPAGQWSLVHYRNRVRDLIAVQCDPVTFNCSVYNVNRARLEGWTLSGNRDLGEWKLSASLDAQDPRDELTGRQLARRALYHGAAGATHSRGRWQIGAEAVFSGARFDDAQNTQRLKAYTVVNLTASYGLRGGWALFARLNNIANEKYELVRNYATPGANAFVGLRYQVQ